MVSGHYCSISLSYFLFRAIRFQTAKHLQSSLILTKVGCLLRRYCVQHSGSRPLKQDWLAESQVARRFVRWSKGFVYQQRPPEINCCRFLRKLAFIARQNWLLWSVDCEYGKRH